MGQAVARRMAEAQTPGAVVNVSTARQAVGARNLAGYNRLSATPLPLRLVVIDELTDLTLAAGGPRSELFKKLIRVASTGRALGVLFVLATQSPRAEIVNGNLKACMNTRIAFRCASRTDAAGGRRGQTEPECLPTR